MIRTFKWLSAGLLFFALSAHAVLVTLDITFDDFPEETAFGIFDAATAPSLDDIADGTADIFEGIAYDVDMSSPIGFGDGYVLPGDFAGENNVTAQFIWDLTPGDYIFFITDAFGDGICCEFGDGSYSLSIFGDEIVGGGAFSTYTISNFTVPIPVPGAIVLFGTLMAGWIGFGRRKRS